MLRELDQEFTKRFKRLEQSIEKLFKARQPYIGDWYDFTEKIEYVSAGTLRFANSEIDPRTRVQRGDLIRWMHSGDSDWRYGYIGHVTATNFIINGGIDYPLDATDPIDFSRGIGNTPIGHPVLLDYDADLRGSLGTLSGVGVSDFTQFAMIGAICLLKFSVSGATITVNPTPILADLPFDTSNVVVERGVGTANDSVGADISLTLVTGTNTVVIRKGAAGGNFAVGAGSVSFTVSMNYRVADV